MFVFGDSKGKESQNQFVAKVVLIIFLNNVFMTRKQILRQQIDLEIPSLWNQQYVAQRHQMVSNFLALLYFPGFYGGKHGSSPNRGQSPILGYRMGDFPPIHPSVHPSVGLRWSICPFPPLCHPARPEAHPARPEA